MIENIDTLFRTMTGDKPLRLYAKFLAPNDNSKNQVYLGGDFSVLTLLPHGEVYSDHAETAGSVRDRAKAPLDFFWIEQGAKERADGAQLILYPKYPEVRLSGFLKGCRIAPSKVMASRDEGRVLFLGVRDNREIIAHAVEYGHPLAQELRKNQPSELTGVFVDLSPSLHGVENSKENLRLALQRIHEAGWITSKRLNSKGDAIPYDKRNGGGYTLEAELGIIPNGISEPDFLGWEIKQFGVRDFKYYRAKSPITLMTPEPIGGMYREQGVETFLREFGYPDISGVADRINFGGVYRIDNGFNARTGLQLRLTGYDLDSKAITDINGGICLVSRDDRIAAEWPYKSIMGHWNRKHAKAAYVPSISKRRPQSYYYGDKVTLCEGTDFLLFLEGIALGSVFYDPGIKMTNSSASRPSIKRRSQFRIYKRHIKILYQASSEESVFR